MVVQDSFVSAPFNLTQHTYTTDRTMLDRPNEQYKSGPMAIPNLVNIVTVNDLS